jgi:hypothetical protein
MKSWFVLAAFGLIGPSLLATTINSLPDCQEDTLASYTATYSLGNGRGCKIGNLGFSKFYFEEFAATAGAPDTLNIEASDLIIRPNAATNSFSILPSTLSLFNRVITAPERYYISYFVDPPPIIAGDELTLDPPVGNVFAAKWGCTDSDFAPGANNIEDTLLTVGRPGYSASTFSCGPSGAAPYLLKADGTSPSFANVTDSIVFTSPVATINVRLVLDFEPGTIEGFEGILNPVETTIPEPAANAMIGGGLLALGLLGQRLQQRK